MVERLDPLMSPPPALQQAELRQILRDSYGIDASLTPLAGERDQNFRVEPGDGRRFLLKVSNPIDDRSVIDMQTAALRHIERCDPDLPVVRTLPATAGESWIEVPGPDGRSCPVLLFTFLPGTVVKPAALTSQAIWSFGETTARCGRALRGFFHPRADYEILWGLKHAPKLRPLLPHLGDTGRRGQVERILDRFDARVAPALPGLRAQVIHGDMSLDNVLFGDDLRISGIVDFGDMSHAPLVSDLAVAIADVLHGHADPLAGAEQMIAGYVSVTPLDDEEARLLADLVMARLATEVTVTAWRVGLYPDNAAYSVHGEPAARGFLDSVEAVGIDADDRRYLDCYNNVPVVGHSHPRVVQAVAQQQRLLATHSRYLHEAIVALAERLTSALPAGLDAVLLVNSGSEANDLAWRVARAATGRGGAIVSAYGYHGLTEATHALSPEEWAQGERPAHVATVPAPDGYRGAYRREEAGWAERYAAQVENAAQALAGGALAGPGLAAMFIDPAFTADGILAPPPAYLREAARRIRALGGLLVADEVQAGHGRSGTGLWSFQAAGIEPDMVVMGKPMGNGFPVAALVARSEVLAQVPAETELFSTFGGNPVAGVAALAVLDVIEDEGLVQNAAEVGGYLCEGLAKLAQSHTLIGDVRGEGLLLAAELVEDRETRAPAAVAARRVAEAMRDRGVLLGVTGPAGNVLKIRPPLTFQREHAGLLLEVLDDVLASP